MSQLEDRFAALLDEWGFDRYEREYRFSPSRRFRFDFAWPHLKLAAELHGGLYRYLPSHASARRIERGYDKLNEAQLHGWIVLQFSSGQLSRRGVDAVQEMLVRAAALRGGSAT